MSDKPREIFAWYEHGGTCFDCEFEVRKSEGQIRFIEYSAYEQMKKEVQAKNELCESLTRERDAALLREDRQEYFHFEEITKLKTELKEAKQKDMDSQDAFDSLKDDLKYVEQEREHLKAELANFQSKNIAEEIRILADHQACALANEVSSLKAENEKLRQELKDYKRIHGEWLKGEK